MSDSVRPHRRQPTRLRRPWDSPGRNTGVGCHFLLQCVKVKSESEVAQSCPTLSDPIRLLCPWDFPGKSTGVGCHCLLRLIIAAIHISALPKLPQMGHIFSNKDMDVHKGLWLNRVKGKLRPYSLSLRLIHDIGLKSNNPVS